VHIQLQLVDNETPSSFDQLDYLDQLPFAGIWHSTEPERGDLEETKILMI
jgi:hypothetical protein